MEKRCVSIWILHYNDATFNVVYVDSHDYSPGPNDGIRFNGGTSQWAENLSWMFTFRGIPCLYYGSEVEFMAGSIIDDGMNTPLNKTGRAYFGHYLEGEVRATDFANYSASGQVAQTLNGDLAHHIQQLNKIRAAVPALRKGQYTFDGCSANGGWAFKRAYENSYALVAVNGGATFSNVPAGTYTDIVTGKTYNGGGSITVDAPRTQGQLRVLVKDWTGGKVVDEGKFIYSSSPVSKGGNPTATDPGASFFYTSIDAVDESVGMIFSPNKTNFKTETLTVTVTLTAGATSGTFTVGEGTAQTITQGETKTFTIGEDMSYDESITITWTATGNEGDESGSITYNKINPNKAITVYCKAQSAPNLYAWRTYTKETINGAWPGAKMSNTTTVNDVEYYYLEFNNEDNISIIFNNGNGKQTADITNITESVFYEYDGETTATLINPDDNNSTNDEDVYTLYFDNSFSNWSNVYAYAWDAGNGNKELLGGWPGSPMTYNDESGLWKISFTPDATLVSPMVIFNNGSGTQTYDLVLNNNSIYNSNGDIETGINDTYKNSSIKVYTKDGVLEIHSSESTKVSVSRADGITHFIDVNAGVNFIDWLPRGFYIINRKKVIL